MNRALAQYNPPSFNVPPTHEYKAFFDTVVDFLQNRQAQYQIQFLQQVIEVINTGTQTFGLDLPATATLNITNWAHRISGTGTIVTITPPNGFQSFIVLLSLDGFTYTTGGNISNSGGVTAGHPALLIYDPVGLLWWVLSA